MSGHFRSPGGRYTLVAAGVALLLLAAGAAALPLGPLGLVLAAGALIAALVCFWRAWAAARADRYDLSRLFDAPPPEPEDPYDDTLPQADAAAPYCGWCDEAYAPGTRQCRTCGRPLG